MSFIRRVMLLTVAFTQNSFAGQKSVMLDHDRSLTHELDGIRESFHKAVPETRLFYAIKLVQPDNAVLVFATIVYNKPDSTEMAPVRKIFQTLSLTPPGMPALQPGSQ